MQTNNKRSLTCGAIIIACLVLAGCFTFYDGSLDGFTVDGIYDGGTSVNISTCSDAVLSSYLTQAPGISYDSTTDPLTGSLRLRAVTDCFPDDASTGFARFDFVSPHLSNWDSVAGYTFAVKSFVNDIQVQPLLEVERADGEVVFQRMVDAVGRPIFISVPNDWGWHQYAFVRPAADPGDIVIGMRVRVFVPNRSIRLSDDFFIYLDAVFPN